MTVDKLVFSLPQFPDGFTFTEEFIIFFIGVFLIILGISTCIKGYKILNLSIVVSLFCVIGYYGMKLAASITDIVLVQMVLLVTFIFFGGSILLLLNFSLVKILDMLGIKNTMKKYHHIIASLFGAGIISCVIYKQVYRGMVICWILFIIGSISSMIYQHKKKKRDITFYTYNDLYKLKPLENEIDRMN